MEVGECLARAVTALVLLGTSEQTLSAFDRHYDDIMLLPSIRDDQRTVARAASSRPMGTALRADRSWNSVKEHITTVKMTLCFSHLLSWSLPALELSTGTTKFFQASEKARECIAMLCDRLGDCVTACAEQAPAGQKAETRERLADKIVQADVLPGLIASCRGVATALKQQQQQSTKEQQDAARALASFSQALLYCWNGIATAWPGVVLCGSQNPIVETVGPAIQLATAVFTELVPAAASRAASSSSSGSSRSSSTSLTKARESAIWTAMSTASVLAAKVDRDCALTQYDTPETKAQRQQLLVRNDLQLLLLVYMAFVTQQLHSKLRGRTAVSPAVMQPRTAGKSQQPKQQQQQQQMQMQEVEPHHLSLLEALNLTCLADEHVINPAGAPAVADSPSATRAALALCYQVKAAVSEGLAKGHVTTGSSSQGDLLHYFPLGSVLPIDVHMPLLLVELELQQLLPNIHVAEANLQLMAMVADTYGQALLQHATEQGMPAAVTSGFVAAEVGRLVEPFVHLLGPAVVHAVKADLRAKMKPGGAAAIAADQEEGFEIGADGDVMNLNNYAGVIMKLVLSASQGAVAAAFRHNPLTSSIVFESTLRLQAHAARAGQLGAMPPGKLPRPANAVSDRLLVLAYKLASAVAGTEAATVAAAGAAGNAQQLPLQLLSLLLSCMKYAGYSSSEDVTNSPEVLELLGMIVQVGVRAGAGEYTSSSSSSSSGSSSSSSESATVVPGVAAVLVGRGLALIGRVLRAAFEQSAQLRHAVVRMAPGGPEAEGSSTEQLLDRVVAGVSWLGQQLQQHGLQGDKSAAAEQALQELLQQQADLQQGLVRAQAQLLRSGASSEAPFVPEAKRVISSELVQQLQQFGEAICAQLPLPYMCNFAHVIFFVHDNSAVCERLGFLSVWSCPG